MYLSYSEILWIRLKFDWIDMVGFCYCMNEIVCYIIYLFKIDILFRVLLIFVIF